MTGAADAGGGYRPEIDGLRAVAIVPVVLFHAGVPGFVGGFVGVDVFFVISGYLITGILAADIAAGRLSIGTFYARRVRRIFPALFVVLAASTLAALGLLLPFELEDFGQAMVAAALFVSNFHFMLDNGYFAGTAEREPLLHLWSLAVEEQFYIVFPPLLWALWRLAPGRRRAVLAGALAASFLLCVATTRAGSDWTFYFSPARAWELLAGGWLALAVRRRPLPGPVAETLAFAGLALIAVAVVGLDRSTPYPGAAAALPVGGTVLVIGACTTNRTMVGRALSLGPVRLVGLVSYALYLWHWPLLVFYRIWRITPPASWEIAVVVAVAFAASWLTWRYVELPFRRVPAGGFRSRLLGGGAAAVAAGAVLGGALIATGGLPGRLAPEVRAVAAVRDDAPRLEDCAAVPGDEGAPCRLGDTSGPASFVLWGDSHARMLVPAFATAARQSGEAVIYLGALGCPPLIGVNQVREGFEDCAAENAAILREIGARPEAGTVILAARWALYARGLRFGEDAAPVLIRDATSRPGEVENLEVFARGFERTLAALAASGRRVVIVAQVPETGYDVPSETARAAWFGRTADLRPWAADHRAWQAGVARLFRSAEGRYPDTVVLADPGALLCGQVRCEVMHGDLPVYRDSNHLTATFAAALGPGLAEVLEMAR